jgi:hypothetical protein
MSCSDDGGIYTSLDMQAVEKKCVAVVAIKLVAKSIY